MYEMHFLRDIAEQNYSKYNIDINNNFLKGITLSVYSMQSIGLAITRFYSVLKDAVSFNLQPTLSLPTWDQTSEGIVQIVAYDEP